MGNVNQKAVSFWGDVAETIGAPTSNPLLVATDAENSGTINFVITPPVDAGYNNTKIYQAAGSGAFTILVDTIVAPATTGSASGLTNNFTYSFIAIAYNDDGLKSLSSNVARMRVTDGTLGYDASILMEGIYSTYEASFLKGQIPLNYYQAPQPNVFPYINYFPISSVPEDTMSDKQNSKVISFDVYSGEKESAKQMYLWAAKLDKVFDEANIVLDGQKIIRINRVVFIKHRCRGGERRVG